MKNHNNNIAGKKIYREFLFLHHASQRCHIKYKYK
jgi:hypothetical protein